MSDQPEENRTDDRHKTPQEKPAADLLDWELVETPELKHENAVGLRLHLRRGHDNDGYPLLAVDRDGLADMAQEILKALDP